MKKILGMMLMALLMVPTGGMAMSHGEHDKKMDMDHGSMEKMDHSKMDHGSGMAMGGDKIMLQDVEVDGVMASGHMLDTKEKMAEHGMALTHHLMVSFMDSEGASLKYGTVAVKIESPDGTVSKPVRMMGMSGAFGADINLDQQGMYMFKVGTKLADGKKRTFSMHYVNK